MTTTSAPQILIDIARRLKSARSSAGMSQEQVAEKAQVSRSQVIAWESAKNAPPSLFIRQVREIFGVSPEWILCGPGEVPLKFVGPADLDAQAVAVREVMDEARKKGISLPEAAASHIVAEIGALPVEDREERTAFLLQLIGLVSER